MKFLCRGFDKAGKPATEVVEAANKAEAIELLRRKGVFVTDAAAQADGVPAPRAARPTSGVGGARPNLDRVADFFRQLALLVSTGTPLVDAMDSLRKQINDPGWRAVVDALHTRVEEGTQLSEAMAAFPRQFDGVCRSLVAAGEQGGKLDAMLSRLSKLTRQQARIRKTVQGALVYPALLIAISVAVVSAMLGFVLPRFEGLFKTLHVPLPITTEWLMAASGFIRDWWWAIGLAMATVGTLLWAYLRTPEGRVARDGMLVRLPQIGRLTRSFATARIARMLGVLLEGKVALLDALALTRQSMGNTCYIELIRKAEESVTRGESVSAALTDPTLINSSVCDAIRSAERSGQIGSVLMSVADHLDEDNEMLVKTVTGLLEPVILVVLGLVVGTMAISMFLPLFDLTAAGAGGGAMMQRWLKGTRRTPIGIDVSHRSLRAVQFEQGGKTLAAATRIVREAPGTAVTAAELTRLAQGLARAGFEGSRVVASAPPDALLTAMLDLPPRSSGAPIDQLMRTELARVHKLDPDQIEAGGWDVPGLGRTNEATHVMAVGMARDRAESLFAAFQEAGLTLAAIEARSCALARGTISCAEQPPSDQAPALTGILELGWNAALLVVMADGAIVYDRVMSEAGVDRLVAAAKSRVGLDAQTTLLTLSRQGGSHAQEQAPTPAQAALQSELRGCLTSFLELLVPETEQALAYVSHRHNASVGTLSIVGEGAAFPAVLGGLTGALGAEVARPTLHGTAGIDLSVCGGELLVAAGLSLHELASPALDERRAA